MELMTYLAFSSLAGSLLFLLAATLCGYSAYRGDPATRGQFAVLLLSLVVIRVLHLAAVVMPTDPQSWLLTLGYLLDAPVILMISGAVSYELIPSVSYYWRQRRSGKLLAVGAAQVSLTMFLTSAALWPGAYTPGLLDLPLIALGSVAPFLWLYVYFMSRDERRSLASDKPNLRLPTHGSRLKRHQLIRRLPLPNQLQ